MIGIFNFGNFFVFRAMKHFRNLDNRATVESNDTTLETVHQNTVTLVGIHQKLFLKFDFQLALFPIKLVAVGNLGCHSLDCMFVV